MLRRCTQLNGLMRVCPAASGLDDIRNVLRIVMAGERALAGRGTAGILGRNLSQLGFLRH